MPQNAPPRLDLDAVELFLRVHETWLHEGLRLADDAAALGVVLGTHDAAHDVWIGLIAAIRAALDPAAADALIDAYRTHGRVVGALERGAPPRLAPDVARRVRDVLAAELRRTTATAVAALRDAPTG